MTESRPDEFLASASGRSKDIGRDLWERLVADSFNLGERLVFKLPLTAAIRLNVVALLVLWFRNLPALED